MVRFKNNYLPLVKIKLFEKNLHWQQYLIKYKVHQFFFFCNAIVWYESWTVDYIIKYYIMHNVVVISLQYAFFIFTQKTYRYFTRQFNVLFHQTNISLLVIPISSTRMLFLKKKKNKPPAPPSLYSLYCQA